MSHVTETTTFHAGWTRDTQHTTQTATWVHLILPGLSHPHSPNLHSPNGKFRPSRCFSCCSCEGNSLSVGPNVNSSNTIKLNSVFNISFAISKMSTHSITSSNSSLDDGHGKHERRGQKGVKCLPCFTHISTGACIYGEHCRFIHDKNIFSTSLPNTTLEQRNNVDHKIRDDPIYWPPSFHSNIVDEYTLDKKIVFHDDLRYKAIFSMWGYFVGTVSQEPRLWQNLPENPMTKRQRLPVFQKLADGVPADVQTEAVKISPLSYSNAAKSSHKRSAFPRSVSYLSKNQSQRQHMISHHSSLDISAHTLARMSA